MCFTFNGRTVIKFRNVEVVLLPKRVSSFWQVTVLGYIHIGTRRTRTSCGLCLFETSEECAHCKRSWGYMSGVWEEKKRRGGPGHEYAGRINTYEYIYRMYLFVC